MRCGLLVVLSLASMGGCKGLSLDEPNAWPCDYSLGPTARDEPCHAGDVCGINDRCRAFVDEGPRFTDGFTLPVSGPGSAQGIVLSPSVLDDGVKRVARDVLPGSPRLVALDDGLYALDEQNHVKRFGDGVIGQQPFFPFGRRGGSLALVWSGGGLAVVDLEGGMSRVVQGWGSKPDAVVVSPAFAFGELVSVPILTRRSPAAMALVRPSAGPGGGYTAVAVDVSTDAGLPLDAVVGVPAREGLSIIALQGPQLFLYDDQGIDAPQPLATLDGLPVPDAMQARGTQMRTDVGGHLLAIDRNGALSTFLVNVGDGQVQLTRAWPDCRPCEALNDAITVLAPTSSSGVAQVEVRCGTGVSSSSVTVIGSVARTPNDSCSTSPLEPFVSLRRNEPVSWQGQAGVMLGGAHGQVWSGDSLSTLLPAYLDRVPSDVATVTIDGVSTFAAMTSSYVTVQQGEVDAGVRNGLRRVSNSELRLQAGTRLLAFVRGVDSWALSANGSLVRLTSAPNLGDGGIARYGPTLVRPTLEPISQSTGGEAVSSLDAGLAFYVAAHDSVYLVANPQNETTERPSTGVVTPSLTPEPNVPLRSFTVDRSPQGTDGPLRGSGYLVTSRNVYAWRLTGQPARWSSTQVPLINGEPLEVWFDADDNSLGRVGFRSGEIYTLPGGFQLTPPLPAGSSDVSVEVLDYENLGGWPVAYASTGVFVALPAASGALLQWQEMTLPDGTRPWLHGRRGAAVQGRLFVQASGTNFKLLVFFDDMVLQLAEHSRRSH